MTEKNKAPAGKFTKGQSGNPAGRPPGPNKVTTEVKKALQMAFEGLGGVPQLEVWANANSTEFYKLWAKMLPTEVKAEVETSGKLVIEWKTPVT